MDFLNFHVFTIAKVGHQRRRLLITWPKQTKRRPLRKGECAASSGTKSSRLDICFNGMCPVPLFHPIHPDTLRHRVATPSSKVCPRRHQRQLLFKTGVGSGTGLDSSPLRMGAVDFVPFGIRNVITGKYPMFEIWSNILILMYSCENFWLIHENFLHPNFYLLVWMVLLSYKHILKCRSLST